MQRIERKLYGGFFCFFLLLVGVISFAFYAVHRIVNDQRAYLAHQNEELLQLRTLSNKLQTQFNFMPLFVLNGTVALLERFETARSAFTHELDIAQDLIRSPFTLKVLHEIEELELKARQRAQQGIEMRLKGSSVADVNAYFEAKAEPITTQITMLMRGAVRAAKGNAQEARAQLKTSVDRMQTGLIVASGTALFFSALAMGMLSKLVRFKKREEENVRALAAQQSRLAKARQEMLEMVAHDLKNPLSAVEIAIELIRREGNLSASQLGDLDIISSSGESMNGLIQDLLDSARSEAEVLTLSSAQYDVGELVRAQVKGLSLIAESRRIVLRLRNRAKSGTIYGDAGRIEQVFSNLVGNAIKFTPEGGLIDIWMSNENGGLLVSVKDNGPGISHENQQRVFDRYWQVKTAERKGTGLGLAISKQVIEAHGGIIGVKSELGFGAEFYFWLPLSIHEARVPSVNPALPRSLLPASV